MALKPNPTDPVGAHAPTVLQPSLRFDRVSGMTKGAVAAIAQDPSGYLWFATEEGLSRYDGYEYVNYAAGTNPDNTLSNFTLTSLAVAKDALWIGTMKGLNRLDLGTYKFTHYLSKASDPTTLSSDYVVSIAFAKDGTLWIGTAETGVDAMDIATGKVKHYRHDDRRPDSIASDAIAAVFEDRGGRLWVATRDAGLDQLDPATGKAKHYAHDGERIGSLSNDQVTTIYEDKGGVLWIGTMDGLNRLDPGAGTFKRYLVGGETDPKWITTIVEGTDNGLWLGIKGVGVYRFDPKTGGVEKYVHDAEDETSLGNPWTRSTFSDREGVLWFGFSSGEVSKLNPMRRSLAYYRTNPGLSFLESGNVVWLGSSGRGIRSLDLKTGDVKSYLDDQLSATWTMRIIEGEPGWLWIGTTDRGLFHFNPSTGELEAYNTGGGGLTSDAVFALYREGPILWIGTFGAGLVRLDTKKKTAEYFATDKKKPNTLSSDHVLAIHQDRTRPDILWVGTNEGLNEFNKKTASAVRYMRDPNQPDSLSHDHITDIHEDRAGRLWVATWGGGLNVLDRKTGKFKAYRTKQGLSSDVMYGILEDKAGALWITTNDGLTKFDPDKGTAFNFRESDGLSSDEFAQGGFHQGPSGRFYTGGPRGFNLFFPEQVRLDTTPPPVVLTKFEILGAAKPIPERVILGFRDRWFSASFSSLAYASPHHNRYRYRLTGFHDWIETDRRFVNYSSLPPGDYVLEIIGSNAHGVWNEQGLKLPIHVRPPPWRTWWAYTSYGALALLIVTLVLRRQSKQLAMLRQAHRLSVLEREMALTSAVQEGFFPPEPSVNENGFQLEAFYRAATECSGDWWWYERRGNEYFILVGDVTGHGAGSAMVTAAVAACCRSLGDRVDDDQRLIEMNEEVLRVSRGQYHMTLTAITLDLDTGMFLIRSAGGVPVFSLPPNERIKVHMCPGMPLGSPDFQVGRLEGQLAPGERMLIMTDGIPEVAMPNSQLLGPRGVSHFYIQTRDQALPVALQQLIKKVEAVQSGAQDDDWTAVMLQWDGPVATIQRHRSFDGNPAFAVGR